MTRFATFENNERRTGGSQKVTGAEVNEYLVDTKRVITTDSEKSLVARQASHVKQIELRTYVFLDSLQPQLAAYMGTASSGFLPIPGDACLWMEVSPGMAVHRVTDIALKASNVRLGQMIVERAFGSLALYHRDQSTVLHSGDVVLDAIGSTIDRRTNPQVTWTEVIRSITPDHAVLINRQNRRGSMIQSGMSMFILETEPAGYVLMAANEAEKASNITIVDVKGVGAFGRLTLAGKEGDVEEAAAAAMKDTFDKDPIPTRGGGSIPIVALFEKELETKTVLMGFGLDSDAIHSPNEHYGVFNYFRGIETIPRFFHHFAEMNK